MKKIYLLVSGLCLVAGSVNAQTAIEGVTAPANYATNPAPEFRGIPGVLGDREADDVIWEDNFDTPENWLFDGPDYFRFFDIWMVNWN